MLFSMRSLKRYPSLILIIGFVLGAFPPTLYYLAVSGMLRPPAPTSQWDSRPCEALPSATTCNGIMPYAPYDATIITKQPGSGLCINANTRHSTQYITDNHNQSFAILELWQSPTCRTSFAHIQTTRGIYGTLTVEITTYPTRGSRWTEANYTVTYTSTTKNSNAAWSVMAYTPDDMAVSSCGYLSYREKSYGECIGDTIV